MKIICKYCNTYRDEAGNPDAKVYKICTNCDAFFKHLHDTMVRYAVCYHGMTISTNSLDSITIYLRDQSYDIKDESFNTILIKLGLHNLNVKSTLHTHAGCVYIIRIVSVSHREIITNPNDTYEHVSVYHIKYDIRRYNLSLYKLCNDAIVLQSKAGYKHAFNLLPTDLKDRLMKKIVYSIDC